jgi:hypothetical protein
MIMQIPKRKILNLALLLPGVLALAACAPPMYRVQRSPGPAAVAPQPSVTVYFFPKHGQSREQQERDRYECYQWAVKQTGYDPGRAMAPHQRVEVTPAAPPGANVASGAMTGAVVGSIMSGPRDHGQGMVFGAIAGAMLGAAKEQAEQEQAARMTEQYNSRDYARVEEQARNYRRAMTACLVGRGYTVK